MENYLWETRELFKNGKYKIHIILYIINSSEPRNFNQNEIKLIDFINKQMNIQIFFVCTLAENNEKGTYRKETIKINLIQIFGKDTPLVNFIYPCQLLDEKDGKAKRFGIDTLIKKIYNFCEEEKPYLETTKSNISNNPNNNNYNKNLDNHNNNNYIQNLDNQNNKNYNQNLYYRNKNLDNQNNNNIYPNMSVRDENVGCPNFDNRNKNLDNQNNNNYIQNLDNQNNNNNIQNNNNYNQPSDNHIFLKSLNQYNYNELENYLVNFCERIIQYYETYFKEIENYNLLSTKNTKFEIKPYMDELKKIRKIIANLLIKHLAYELNVDLSNNEIKKQIDSFENPENDNQISIQKVGNKAKNLFLKNIKQNLDSQNQNDGYYNYFKNLIDDYINVIKSLEKYKEIII